jgi:hypothetical protein
VLLEGLGKLKKKIHLIGTRTHDLPAFSIAPEPTPLQRAPWVMCTEIEISVDPILRRPPAKMRFPEEFPDMRNIFLFSSQYGLLFCVDECA